MKPRRINEFRGNDFRQAELIDTAFICGIDLDGMFGWIMPRQRIAEARREVATWTDPEARREALLMLEVYGNEAAPFREKNFGTGP